MTVTACILAVLLCLGGAAQFGAAVVCIGSDGHVDAEPSVCTCCAGTASHDDRVHSGLMPASPTCSDCVNVLLRMPPLRSRDAQLSTPHIGAEERMPAQSCGSCRIDLVVPAKQMDQHWQSLFPVSTVVLLT